VIVPSLPGFGFSDRPRQRGGIDAGMLCARLMTDVLGYTRFGAHAGDTGSPIAQALTVKQPDAVVGIHLTDIGWNNRLSPDMPNLSPAEQQYLKTLQTWTFSEGGYIMIQGTKPQTLAYGLKTRRSG
jgi:pimeloyl-ACP methyl ester carboxylesterase